MPSPARRAAYAVVRRTLEQDAYADRALHGEAQGLDARERALAKRLAFGAAQYRGTLDWAIARHVDRVLDPEVRAALHIGLYQLLFTEVADHAAVSESVELAKPNRGAGLVNAVLRKVQRDGLELPADDDPAGAAIRHGHPEWLARTWWDWLGPDRARALMARNNEPAELALRVNTLVTREVDLPGRRDGDALILDGPHDVLASELYTTGAITPQSRASQRVSTTVAPQPGERVLDLCAAPGGKTTHLAALMGDEGEVVAVERNPQRARALRAQAERLRATCVRVEVQDAAEPVPGAPFDRVLLDPPCSGLGTLQSHPDLRWRATPERIEGLTRVQARLLDAARAAVKPGGVLVYSVCTLSPAEELLQAPEHWRTLPSEDDTDGFYTARDVL